MKARVYFFLWLALSAVAPAQTIQPGGAKSSHLSVSTLSGGINLRSLEGAPFSADVVKESTEQMPDGTSAHHETLGKMFRDSLGRTRSETELKSAAAGAEARHYVTIIDPVLQESIVLDIAARTASISRIPAAPAQVKHAVLPRSAMKSISAGKDGEDLGAMTVEGFSVTGARRTQPAFAGAAKENAHVTETWFSPELKIELLSTTQLSSTITQSTRLMNIVSGEPDPALFQVPSGYAVTDHSQQK